MTGDWPVKECKRLSNAVADSSDGMKLRILKSGTFTIDGFKIVTEKSITISKTDLIVTGDVPIRQKIKKILFFQMDCDPLSQSL